MTSKHSRDQILKRLERQAVDLGALGASDGGGEFSDCTYANVDKYGRLIRQQRWRVDEKWIEFECGCRAERNRHLHGAQPWEPIIFVGLPEQAVYDFVCSTHNAGMNVRFMGHFVDFGQWHRERRKKLMGH